jgi:pyruvate/oxaloacetate carboxyltransferase
MFERDALDYMLSELYGGVDVEAVRRFLNDSPASTDQQVQEDAKKTTLTSFINKLNQYVSKAGVVNQKLVEEEGYG